MLYPGHSAEDEFPALERRLGGVRLPVVHTWEGPTEHSVRALRALGGRDQLVPAAAKARRQHRPDAVVWACTSGSFVYGPDGVREQAQWVASAADVPASSTSIAFLEALRALGVRRVSVAATYPATVTQHFTDLLAADGVEVCAVTSGDVPSGEDAGRLDPGQVTELVLGGGHPDEAGAVVVPDTALHTVGQIADWEARLGRPVLTANQVSAWHGLRLAGWQGSTPGLGALFANGAGAV
jgi:maleate cis-trans isomerase